MRLQSSLIFQMKILQMEAWMAGSFFLLFIKKAGWSFDIGEHFNLHAQVLRLEGEKKINQAQSQWVTPWWLVVFLTTTQGFWLVKPYSDHSQITQTKKKIAMIDLKMLDRRNGQTYPRVGGDSLHLSILSEGVRRWLRFTLTREEEEGGSLIFWLKHMCSTCFTSKSECKFLQRQSKN